jgi:protein phosphatase 2C
MDRRRRRLEMKRFRLASDLEESAAEYARAGKSQRLGRTVSGPCPAPCAAASPSSQDPDRCPRYGVSSVCGRRREMEDAVSVRPDFLSGSHFFGVFDGHGCSHVRRPHSASFRNFKFYYYTQQSLSIRVLIVEFRPAL